MLVNNSDSVSSLLNGVSSDSDSQNKKDQQKTTLFDKIMQQVLDNRVGLDRKKLEELQEKIDKIKQDKSLSKDQQTAQLKPLQKQQDELYKQIGQRLSNQSVSSGQPELTTAQAAKLQPLLDSLKQQLLVANQAGQSSAI